MTGMNIATGCIYFGEYRVDTYYLIIQKTHTIFPSAWFHVLLATIYRFMQIGWFMMAGYPFISSHPLPTLLELDLLFLMNSLPVMARYVTWPGPGDARCM